MVMIRRKCQVRPGGLLMDDLAAGTSTLTQPLRTTAETKRLWRKAPVSHDQGISS